MKYLLNSILLAAVIVGLLSCTNGANKTESSENEKITEPIVLIETSLGNIKVKLYNETPIHRDNFLKLAKQGFFDGVIFHRVINNFMVQGGDPTTKTPTEVAEYGEADAGYTINAEFNSKLFHKKGALAAAREGDDVNPEKKSSSSQFYIVQGKVFTPEQLVQLANKKNGNLRNSIHNNLIAEKADRLIDKGANPDFNKIAQETKDTLEQVLAKKGLYGFEDYKVDFYTTVGGTPHLDGDYTVFGEVIEGLEVVDKIAAVKTNKSDRPIVNITMKMKVLVGISENKTE
jgi:cyclophilin family peptidyl-prolyl cis-trans isomerase